MMGIGLINNKNIGELNNNKKEIVKTNAKVLLQRRYKEKYVENLNK